MSGATDALNKYLEIRQIPQWTDFAQTINGQIGEVNAGRFVFRGQPDSRFALESSFDRVIGRGLSPKQRRRVLKRIMGAFAAVATRSEMAVPTSQKALMGLGQHFGLQTRMLDWSESKYVAAFFAFASLNARYGTSLDAEADPDTYVSVFALDTAHGLWSKDTIQVLRVSTDASDRLHRQRGLFTVNHTEHLSVESFLENYARTYPDRDDTIAIYRFDLPVREVKTALRDLAQMRISHSELFPGLEGIARETMLVEWLDQ